MIMVELFLQELNQQYDVHLDETIPIGSLLDSLVELISQKEHLPVSKNAGMFLLCDTENGRIMHPDTTLSENGICSGQRLLLL